MTKAELTSKIEKIKFDSTTAYMAIYANYIEATQKSKEYAWYKDEAYGLFRALYILELHDTSGMIDSAEMPDIYFYRLDTLLDKFSEKEHRIQK